MAREGRLGSRIAVIGAGAKGAAIAAKADCLNRALNVEIEVTLFERADHAAANWRGDSGYTDGNQVLCTPPYHDLGYPYDHYSYDHVDKSVVAQLMQSEYSWMQYAVRRGQDMRPWSQHFETAPTHSVFADYICDAIDRSNAKLKTGFDVKALRVKNAKWTVSALPVGETQTQDFKEFDGLVVTGPGPSRDSFEGFRHPALFNAEDVWLRLPQLLERLKAINPSDEDSGVVIVGAGGAAASVAAWIVAAGFEQLQIKFISEHGAIYTRSAGYFEQQLFENDEQWRVMGEKAQDEFVDRITRSVVWENVTDTLKRSKNIVVTSGRAKPEIAVEFDTPHLSLLNVPVKPTIKDADEMEVFGNVVIDAAGFDPWWFKKLLRAPFSNASRRYLKKRSRLMDDHLCVSLPGFPPLHAPWHSQARGAGLGSLLTLGRMSDQILEKYLQGAET